MPGGVAWGGGAGPGHGTEGRAEEEEEAVQCSWEGALGSIRGPGGGREGQAASATSLGCSARPTNHSPLNPSQTLPKENKVPNRFKATECLRCLVGGNLGSMGE